MGKVVQVKVAVSTFQWVQGGQNRPNLTLRPVFRLLCCNELKCVEPVCEMVSSILHQTQVGIVEKAGKRRLQKLVASAYRCTVMTVLLPDSEFFLAVQMPATNEVHLAALCEKSKMAVETDFIFDI